MKFLMAFTFFISTSLFGEAREAEAYVVAPTSEAAIDKAELKKIFRCSKELLLPNLVALWKGREPFKSIRDRFRETNKIGKAHSDREISSAVWCNKNAHMRKWMEWRQIKSCYVPKGEGYDFTTPEKFREGLIKQFNTMVTTSLIETKMIQGVASEELLPWTAIGTASYSSDIDTVTECTKKGCTPDSSKDTVKGKSKKIIIENMGKSLFDALGIAVYGRSTGVVFDTESYTDVTSDLKEGYIEQVKDTHYRNLGFTLAFVQIARQLMQPVSVGEKDADGHRPEIFSYENFNTDWKGSPSFALVSDAKKFTDLTIADHNPESNLAHYLPITNRLAQEASQAKNEFKVTKLKGILGTYFPEAYYSKEALAHVCYSDDRYSQQFSKIIGDYRKANPGVELDPQNFKNLPGSQNLIVLNKFIYLVSALENLGYFFHKLDNNETSYEALKSSSKYFLRITRALDGYWKIAEADTQKKSTASQLANKYLPKLLDLSSQLERLKRGFLPFTSVKDLDDILKRIKRAFSDNDASWGLVEEDSHTPAKKIYALHMDPFLSKNAKKTQLMSSELVKKISFAVEWNEKDATFEPVETVKEVGGRKKEVCLELAALLNLIAGAENVGVVSAQREKVDRKLKDRTALINFLGKDKKGKLTVVSSRAKLGELTKDEFTEFLRGMVSFLKYTVEDYEKVAPHTFASVELGEMVRAYEPGRKK